VLFVWCSNIEASTPPCGPPLSPLPPRSAVCRKPSTTGFASTKLMQAYAGALEPMFAGVGAEVMWRPINSQWAIGADINRLAQRDFDQRAGLKDYRVSSGHVTAYWDSRWLGVEAKLSMGQYLAADRGATIEVAKRFNNGARLNKAQTLWNLTHSRDSKEWSARTSAPSR
jgi:Exopolysaccharide biosynthesis protein YbjH